MPFPWFFPRFRGPGLWSIFFRGSKNNGSESPWCFFWGIFRIPQMFLFLEKASNFHRVVGHDSPKFCDSQTVYYYYFYNLYMISVNIPWSYLLRSFHRFKSTCFAKNQTHQGIQILAGGPNQTFDPCWLICLSFLWTLGCLKPILPAA